MKKIILAIVISFTLAVWTADGRTSQRRNPVPIVYKIETAPRAGRKRPLRKYKLSDTLLADY